MTHDHDRFARHPVRAALLGLALLIAAAALFGAAPAVAAPSGQVRGRVLSVGTGEAMSFVDVVLTPADTTLRRQGGMTNSDGTFQFDVTPGLWSLQVRALSYAPQRVTGIEVRKGVPVELSIGLEAEAIVQAEVVVEARSIQNNEKALLAQRRKSATVGDAVSAEQVRRSPDKDAGEVLRRVTGLSVQDGKYVFVRGLGERYSSTEVDGVRLVSPEQNKRVVPLDLLPASLLENVVVQKTYSADRPGEFGGGDVQVRTKDFPTRRTFSISATQGVDEGTTFRNVRTYRGAYTDGIGFGAAYREMPDEIRRVAEHKKLSPRGLDPAYGLGRDTLASIGRAFRNDWSPTLAQAFPNGSYFETFGDEWKVLGRSLGFVQSATFSRSINAQDEQNRLFFSGDTLYDYAVNRVNENVQLSGMAAASYRLAAGHSLHLRSLYSRSADDETRFYEGVDHNTMQLQRSNRLMYVERTIFTLGLEGRHEFRALAGSKLDWKLSRSTATRVQPDRRETIYQRFDYVDDQDVPQQQWQLRTSAGGATREFGDLDDRGWGFAGTWSQPLRFGALGQGRVDVGFNLQDKSRNAFYRRFSFLPASGEGDAPPESLFQEGKWTGSATGAQVREFTTPFDNYDAGQRQVAGFISVDVPAGRRLRGVLGVRVERGRQWVRSFDLFSANATTALGELDDVDWLPSANLTWAASEQTNVRLGASRTLSRPDLRELSPAFDLDFIGGLRLGGNPDLERARIDNYDLRIETFPAVSEVVAASLFHKRLHDPIELVIRPGDAPFLQPFNSESGSNVGLELEARSSLARVWKRLDRLFVNANYSRIRSRIHVRELATELGNLEHPLQGQADALFNGALSYTTPTGRTDVSLLLSHVGRRLYTLGVLQPDIYEEPVTTLDAAVNFSPLAPFRMKVSGRNLLDATSRRTQGAFEAAMHRTGRSFAVQISYGS